MLIHKSGIQFLNRKQAKEVMGATRYQNAINNGEFIFVNKEGLIQSK